MQRERRGGRRGGRVEAGADVGGGEQDEEDEEEMVKTDVVEIVMGEEGNEGGLESNILDPSLLDKLPNAEKIPRRFGDTDIREDFHDESRYDGPMPDVDYLEERKKPPRVPLRKVRFSLLLPALSLSLSVYEYI